MRTDQDAERVSQGSCPNSAESELGDSGRGERSSGVAIFCRGRSRCWWLLVVSLIAIRMAVVARDEIVPISHDSVNYAFQAQYYLSPPPVGRLPPQPPGLAWLAIAAAQFGIPFKLALDVIFTAVCLAAGIFVCRLTQSEWAGSLLLAWLLFNPWFINTSVLFMTEPLTAVLVLAIAISAAPFVIRPMSRWSWQAALCSGSLSTYFVLVRHELAPMVCFWAWVAAITATKNWPVVVRLWRLKIPWRWGLVFAPLACMIIGNHLVKRVHLQCYGVPAICASDAPGLRRLLNALYMIEPEQKIRFAPVTRQSLMAACEASPTLNQVRDALSDERKSHYATARSVLKIDREFGTWLNWLLIESFGGMEFDQNQKMERAAEEVLQALRDGRLKSRWGMFPVDPLLEQWKDDVAPTMAQAIRISLYPTLDTSRSVGGFENRRVSDIVELGYFDDRLMRRHGTRSELRFRVSGWMTYDAESEFKSIRLRQSDGSILAETNILPNTAGQPQFNLEIRYEDFVAQDQPKKLVFSPGPGSQYDRVTIDLPEVSGWQDISITVPPSPGIASGQAEKIESWHLSTWIPRKKMQRPNGVQRFLNRNYSWSIWLLVAGLFVVGMVSPAARARTGDIAYLFAAAGGLYLGRAAFYTLLDVWTYWGIDRYVETNHLLLIVLLALASLLCGAGCRGAWAAIKRRPARHEPTFEKRTND